MTDEQLESLKWIAVQGWHATEMYEDKDGRAAFLTTRGHPLAPLVERLLQERGRLLENARTVLFCLMEEDYRGRYVPDELRKAIAFAEQAVP